MISMVFLAAGGVLIKMQIMKRRQDILWTVFLILTAEIALFQIAAAVHVMILEGSMKGSAKALIVPAAVLLILPFLSRYTEEEDSPSEEIVHPDYIGEFVETEDGYRIFMKDEGDFLHEYLLSREDDLRFELFNKEGEEILSVLKPFEDDTTCFILPSQHISGDLLSDFVHGVFRPGDMMTVWYDEDLQRIEAASGGKIIMTVCLREETLGRGCDVWFHG